MGTREQMCVFGLKKQKMKENDDKIHKNENHSIYLIDIPLDHFVCVCVCVGRIALRKVYFLNWSFGQFSIGNF